MWVSWSDTLSGCLASGNRRKSSRLQLLTANHKLLKILLLIVYQRAWVKKRGVVLISLLASVAHNARGVPCVVIRARREHTGPAYLGNPSTKGEKQAWGLAGRLRPEDIMVQTSSSALILWLFLVYEPGHGFFSFWPQPPILLVSSIHSPSLRSPHHSLLWQPLPHPLPPQCPSPQSTAHTLLPLYLFLLNCLSSLRNQEDKLFELIPTESEWPLVPLTLL